MVSNDDFKQFSLYCGKIAETALRAGPMVQTLMAARQIDGTLKLEDLAAYITLPDKTDVQALVCADALLKTFGMDIVGIVTEVGYRLDECPAFRQVFIDDGIPFGPDTMVQALQVDMMDPWRKATAFIVLNPNRSLNINDNPILPVARQGINPMH